MLRSRIHQRSVIAENFPKIYISLYFSKKLASVSYYLFYDAIRYIDGDDVAARYEKAFHADTVGLFSFEFRFSARRKWYGVKH